MKYIGFTIMIFILMLILIKREKIDKKIVKNVVIAYFLSIPTIILVLLFFKVILKNENKGFIKTLINNQNKIITVIQIAFLLGGVMAMYGLYIAEPL